MRNCFALSIGIGFLLGFFSSVSMAAGNKPYFQQEVNYFIHVRLDDHSNLLIGNIEFYYRNNSPDTLRELFIHLWPNAYRDNYTAFAKQQLENNETDFYYAQKEDRGGISNLDFNIDGKEVSWSYYNGMWDVAHVKLNTPLLPQKSLRFTTPFTVKIPKSFSRLGRVEQQYQITQWYPKPAVYDNKGWHPMPYLDQGEFFSEFGTFDVTIEVPQNYVVGATGELVNNTVEPKWLKEREELSRSLLKKEFDNTYGVFAEQFPADSYKKLRYYQENIHDFAWFCDKQYYVLSDTCKLASGKVVKVVAMFNEKDKLNWKNATEYLKEAVISYSNLVGEYPYSTVTAVDGALSAGAGMEYPMITVVSANSDTENLRRVIIHEIGHIWFYGMLASNERKYPWMDEGLNSYYEYRTMDALYKGTGKLGDFSKGINIEELAIKRFTSKNFSLMRAISLVLSGANTHQSINLPAADYTPTNYGVAVYMKPVYALQMLQDYLTTPVFDRCMQEYFRKWQYKHPYPEDLQAVFEQVSGKKLDWFFQEYLNQAKVPDISIKRVTKTKSELITTIETDANYPLPVRIDLIDKSGDTLESRMIEPFTPSVRVSFPNTAKTKWHKIELNPAGTILESNYRNNVYFNKSLFKRGNRPGIAFIGRSTDRIGKAITFLPTLGYNTTDGWMLGAALNYKFFPRQLLGGYIMPMWATRTGELAGSGEIRLSLEGEGNVRLYQLRSRTALFADFLRTKNSFEIFFRPANLRKQETSILSLNTHHLGYRKTNSNSLDFTTLEGYRPYLTTVEWFYNLNKTIKRFMMLAEVGYHKNNIFRTSITARYGFDYKKKREIAIRTFAGTYLTNSNVPYLLQYRASGSFDPMGEQVYLDRNQNSTWLSNQVFLDQGGFRSLIPTASTGKSLAALNLSGALPVTRFSVFANVAWMDFGTTPRISTSAFHNELEGIHTQGDKIFYDAGLALDIVPRVFIVNFPLAGSTYQNNVPATWIDFTRRITFSIELNEFVRSLRW